MRRLILIAAIAWLPLSSAFAEDEPVVAGADVAAWQAVSWTELSPKELLKELRGFVVTWPQSALAEVAWERLGAIPHGRDGLLREMSGAAGELARSADAHRQALERVVVRQVVGAIDIVTPADEEPEKAHGGAKAKLLRMR
jgi:hypothetical protein